MNHHPVLLLTDVVDSTRLTEQLGDAAMSAVWEAHDRAARDLLRGWRGREIDKSDGFLLLFTSATDAVGYALAYQRAIAGLAVPLGARAGLHLGPLVLRENSPADIALGAKPVEVEGLAKPATARIMALAAGGQILLSEPARAALGATAQRVQSHGHWRLKGLDEPVELFEVGDDDAPFTPPADTAKAYRVVRQGELWLPVRELRHTLLVERDAFIGRHDALHELARRIEAGARLVSVLGIGGSGKTRLAQRFGWGWLGDFPGGVWFCDLTQALALDGIVRAVAQGLDVPLGSGDPITRLGDAIAGRGACLVILDNFEQVSRHAEATVGCWLDRAAEARFIVTSREVLGVVGEQVMALPPLPPTDGVALFLRRAAAAVQDFQPSVEDQAAIGPLVELLDGLPLAIELAASRVRVMRPRELLRRMDERFKLLTSAGGRRDRQATLRATFDWSWDLLAPAEKSALAQLSVFDGGFTLTGAEAVLDLSRCEGSPWVADVVQSLVEKSLVRQVDDHRFDLLRSVQDYAAEHLGAERRFDGSGPAARQAAQARHWRHFAGLSERDAVADRCAETDNLVAACRRAAAGNDSAAAVGALAGAWAALRLTGPFRIAPDLAGHIAGLAMLRPEMQATVEWVVGSADYLMGRIAPARERLEAGLNNARLANARRQESLIRCHLGELLTTSGALEQAREHLDGALTLACDIADIPMQCSALNALGALEGGLGNLNEARARYEAALELARQTGDERWAGGLHGNLGVMCHDAGDTNQALEHYIQALASAKRVGDRRWAGNTHCNLGLLYHDLGRAAEAQTELQAALLTAREMALSRLESTVLCNLGIVLESQGKFADARTHYEAAVSLVRSLGLRPSEGQFRVYLGRLYARMGDLAEAGACLSAAEVLLTDAGDRIGLGLLACILVEADLAASDSAAALAHLDRAAMLADEMKVSADSELAREYRRVRQLVDGAVPPHGR